VPRISVVVPIYNVEAYLDACLASLAAQSFGDLEVVMVDDGSTDGSAAIAAEHSRRDGRFRLVSRPNGGLSRARNTGIDASRGEFLAFVDSDDVVPRTAYESLLAALDETGSDLATGNVLQLIRGETTPAGWLTETFARTRLRSHVSEFPPLLADRTAWNKLWRRSFWDAQSLRFPEGVLHEDIPVVLRAHALARAVDVIAEPVYVYRSREGGELSITQRRLERRVLLDRLDAIGHVREVLRQRELDGPLRWYDENLLRDDLRLHLIVLDRADDEYRALFLDRVNALLADMAPDAGRRLPAADRLTWRLVRQRRMAQLAGLVRLRRTVLGLRASVTHRLPPGARARLRHAVRSLGPRRR
jgi:CDP-glycerol glycerophosphotransferase